MIRLIGLTKAFGAGVVALQDVSLRIGKGEFVLLTGPSGAGKTTLLRTIFAAERPDSGQVLIAGRDICRLRESSVPYLRRNVGVVFQDFKLIGDRSALENVSIALEIRAIPRREVQQRSFEALQRVGLGATARTPVHCLSGGEQQRVAIARAVVGAPAIVLADEPTGNLDPQRSRDILHLLAEIAASGTTVLLATHDPMVVSEALHSQLLVLRGGQIAERLVGPAWSPQLAPSVGGAEACGAAAGNASETTSACPGLAPPFLEVSS